MAVKLAVAPIAWSNDDMPELGGDTPLAVCLRESREAGFCGTELGGKFPRDAASLSPLLAEHNLQLAAGWFSGRLRDNGDIGEEMRRLRTQLQTFAALGTTILFYAETSGSTQAQAQTPLSARPVMPDEEFVQYGEKLTALAEKIQSDYGVLMAYHPHIGTAVQSMRDVDMLMANTGAAVGLLADSGHAAFAGNNDDGAIMIRKHAKRIRHIHCKDVRAEQLAKARQSDSSFMHAVWMAFLPCRAMAASTLIRLFWRQPILTIAAGWLWKPNKTRQKPIRSFIRNAAARICANVVRAPVLRLLIDN